jgi:membrane-associated phospholipid phosphatase
MSKYLVLLIWPAGMAVIFGVAFLAWRRNMVLPARAAGHPASHAPGHAPGHPAGHLAGHSGPQPGRHHSRRAGARSAFSDAAAGSVQFGVLAVLGAVVAFGVMALLGLLVVYHGLAIDRPVFRWLSSHQVHAAAAAMKRLTKTGDTWTAWAAAISAAVCLAVTWRDKRWLPPVALASLIVVDHYTTLALRHVFHRVGPPTSPLGTYPSGGCDRVIVFYGLIAYLLWREFSGRRTTAIWVAAVVAALGFNEAYSRVYLSLHWLTDALSGLIYGGLLLLAFILAVRAVAGRPVQPWAGRPVPSMPVGLSTTEGSVT